MTTEICDLCGREYDLDFHHFFVRDYDELEDETNEYNYCSFDCLMRGWIDE